MKSFPSIHDVLAYLRTCNSTPLAHKSADTLYAFLRGFSLGQEPSELVKAEQFLSQFNEWVRQRFKVDSEQAWPKIITFHCLDEASQVALFWKLYDDFVAHRSADRSRATSELRRRKQPA
jgi:hypothetical protein